MSLGILGGNFIAGQASCVPAFDNGTALHAQALSHELPCFFTFSQTASTPIPVKRARECGACYFYAFSQLHGGRKSEPGRMDVMLWMTHS